MWYVENQPDGANVELTVEEVKHSVTVYKCEGANIIIKGKTKMVSVGACVQACRLPVTTAVLLSAVHFSAHARDSSFVVAAPPLSPTFAAVAVCDRYVQKNICRV